MMTAVDLFSGCGGLSLGFQEAGIEILAGIDYWDIALNVYQENFQHLVINQDLSDEIAAIKIIKKLSPEMIIGGSPCQDLSIAKKGRKGLDGERSGLFYEYVRILKEVKPKFFILENVKSMHVKPFLL